MSNFTPIFEDILDSSVWEEPLHVRVLWVSMLALKRNDNIVWKDAYQLCKRCHLELDEVEDALRVLTSPDTKKPNQKFGGRRLEKLADNQWRVLNGEYYQSRMQEVFRKARNAARMRESRARNNKSKPLPGETTNQQVLKEQGEAAAEAHAERIQEELEENRGQSAAGEEEGWGKV